MQARQIQNTLKVWQFKIYRAIFVPFISVNSDNRFIFIVGCYNSGTTLLNALLGSHGEISSLDTEGVMLTDQLHGPEDFGWNRMWHMCRDKLEICELQKKPNPDRLKKEWGFWFDTKKQFWLEKSIINSLNIDWFEKHFDYPYFIWIVRNGYAVSEGIQRRTKEIGKHPTVYAEGYPIDLCARQWVISNQVIEEKLSSVENFMKITYEDLTESPLHSMRLLLDWLPMKHKNIEIPYTFTFQKKTLKIKNLNEESIEHLSLKQIDSINKVAQDMLEHHQYKVILKAS